MLMRVGCYGDEDTVTEGRRRFQAHIERTEVLDADIRSAVYRYKYNQPVVISSSYI